MHSGAAHSSTASSGAVPGIRGIEDSSSTGPLCLVLEQRS